MLGLNYISGQSLCEAYSLKALLYVEVDSSWKIKLGNDKSISYSVSTKKDKELAASILKRTKKDVAWLSLAKKEKNIGYRVFDLKDKWIAWRVYSTVHGKDVSYSVLNGSSVPSSYKIFTIDLSDTSWNINIDVDEIKTTIFEMQKQDIEFGSGKITVLFDEENKTIIFT